LQNCQNQAQPGTNVEQDPQFQQAQQQVQEARQQVGLG